MSLLRVAPWALVLALCASAAAQIPPPVIDRPVVTAQGSGAGDGIEWSGSGNEVRGGVHANADLGITGSGNSFRGSVTYVGAYQAGGSANVFASAPAQVPSRPAPYAIDLLDFAPGGSVHQALTGKYFDRSADCRNSGKWIVDASHFPMLEGVYYAPCDVQMVASSIAGRMTVVATGTIHVAGSQLKVTPFYRGLQFATSSNAMDAIRVSSAKIEIGGLLFAPNAALDIAGSDGVFSCGVVAARLRLAGAGNRFGDALCGSAPEATDTPATTPEDVAVTLELRASDRDSDGLRFEIVTPPRHGSITGSGAQRVYTPEANWHGTDSLVFRALDPFGQADEATVEIIVTPVNDAPRAIGQVLTGTEDVALPVLLAGSDIEHDSLRFEIERIPAHGTLAGTAPDLRYTPNPDFHGPDSFSFVALDPSTRSQPATVSITVASVNDAPRITSTPGSATEVAAVFVYDVDASDPDGDALTYAMTNAPAGATIAAGSGLVSWTPTAAQVPSQGFRIEARDPNGGVAVQVFDVAVIQSNEPPRFTPRRSPSPLPARSTATTQTQSIPTETRSPMRSWQIRSA
jgi:hypothetical protein